MKKFTSSKKIKTALVTGAAGFVGRHLMTVLLSQGIRIHALDNFSCSDPKTLGSLARDAKWFRDDIRNASSVKKAMAGVDVVYHLAAIRSVVRSVEDPFLSHEVNATGTVVLLEAAAGEGIEHFLFTSTSAVYGENGRSHQGEEGPFCPVSPYGIAKLASENYATHYFAHKGIPTTSFRIFNVYGPAQNPESKYSLVIPGVMSRILKGESPVIDGTGKQKRDFVYIDDVLSAMLVATKQPRSFGRVYNVGSGQSVSVLELVQKLIKLSGKNLKPKFGPRRPGDPDSTRADVSRLRRELGWRPEFDLEAGLTRTVQWYMRQNHL